MAGKLLQGRWICNDLHMEQVPYKNKTLKFNALSLLLYNLL
jgi:hypothetical protein